MKKGINKEYVCLYLDRQNMCMVTEIRILVLLPIIPIGLPHTVKDLLESSINQYAGVMEIAYVFIQILVNTGLTKLIVLYT